MTEEQIERAVERKTNNLDARFMRTGSTMTQAEYDAEIAAISQWADKLTENQAAFMREWLNAGRSKP